MTKKSDKKNSNGKKSDKDLRREQILSMHDRGVDSMAIARTLKVSTGTVAAFLAHRTRGTYTGA